VLFSGDWPQRIYGPGDFIRSVVLTSGLWLPLLALLLGRGVATFRDRLEPVMVSTLSRWFGRPLHPRAARPSDAGSVLLGFYGRIVLMQATIILGAFLALLAGTMTPFIVLIAIKTAVDLYFHVKQQA
jgi:hypothetical protein